MKTVLTGTQWHKYLIDNGLSNMGQMQIYNCTHKYKAIYKIKDYYFVFGMNKGYLNLASLKRLA